MELVDLEKQSISGSPPSPGMHHEFQESPKNLAALRPQTLFGGGYQGLSKVNLEGMVQLWSI